MSQSRGRIGFVAVTGVVLSLALTGCLQDPNPRAGGTGGGEGIAQGGSTDGDKVVTVLGAFGGDEAVGFRESLAKFEAESGIKVEYNNSTDFTTIIKARVRSGDTPDATAMAIDNGSATIATVRAASRSRRRQSKLYPSARTVASLGR